MRPSKSSKRTTSSSTPARATACRKASAPRSRWYSSFRPASIQMRACGAEGLAAAGGEAHRVPGEPALPHLGDELAGVERERQLDAAVRGRRVGRSRGVDLEEQRDRSCSRTAGRERKSAQKRVEGAAVLVPQRLGRRGRSSGAAETSKSASPACVANAPKRSGRSMPQTIAPKPPDDLPCDPAVRGLGQRAEALVDERDDLIGEVGAVAPDRGRVEELRAAERREGVDEARRPPRRRPPRPSPARLSTNGATLNHARAWPVSPCSR